MLWDEAADLQLEEFTENTLLPEREASPEPLVAPLPGPSPMFVGFAITASIGALVASAAAIVLFTALGIAVTTPDAPDTVQVVVVE